MDRHVQQRFATVVLAASVTFSISTSPPVDNGDGPGITTVQAREKAYQLPNLLDQRVVILADLDINPNWVGEQSAADSLIYGIVKPDDMVPAGISEDYNYPVTNDCDKEISLFLKADRKKVTIEYANHGEKLYTKTVPLSWLVEQSHRIEKQRQQVDKYASVLRTEQLIGHRRLGL